MINCLITGVGGQGTVLCSKLIAEAAMKEGYTVRTTETIGMAQRGGSVVSHVRMGETIYSPLISKGQADLIISFEPAEAVRLLPYLKKGGKVVVCKAPVNPIINPGAYDSEKILEYLKQQVNDVVIVDSEALCQKCESPKVLNVALLGVALKENVLPITMDVVQEVIKTQVKEQFVALNLKALSIGYGEA